MGENYSLFPLSLPPQKLVLFDQVNYQILQESDWYSLSLFFSNVFISNIL